MPLKAWAIPDYSGATESSPIEQTLLDSSGVTVILLSLIISNYSDTTEAALVITRAAADDTVKFKWKINIPVTSSPFALDSKMVFAGGDKLKIQSNSPDVSVEASGSES